MSITGNWDERRVTRREALGIGGAAAAALAIGPAALARGRPAPGYGPLIPRPDLIALPRGFQYRVISTRDEPMSDGRPTPGDPDGMVAVRGPRNVTILLRNHELGFMDDHITGVTPTPGKAYDPAGRGGTTAVWVSPDRRNVRDYVTSSGTRNNCAGGGTPWGTWLTCEEDIEPGHGFVFETRWDDPEGPLTRDPIEGMGRISHEATDIDPRTGIAYLTEDDFRSEDEVAGSDPRVSFLYRYRPNNRTPAPGALQQGGILEVLTVDEFTTNQQRTMDFYDEGRRFGVVWRMITNPENAREEAKALGGARFNRLEGAHFAGGAFWFDDTVGGEARRGQMFRLLPGASETAPGADVLELFFEATDASESDLPDNVNVTPWGDIWFAEDGGGENRIRGLTPGGQLYTFASTTGSEFAGPTFSPDGRTFFINTQDHGLTYAIWGPFAQRNRARRHRMARSTARHAYSPRISGELAEAAQRHGLTELEAAAYDRLGVALV